MKIRLWHSILLFQVLELLAYEQAVTVKGIINCRGQRMPGLFVQLWDEDSFFEADDLMGSANADYRGVFCVRGFADEFTEIDPFVLIEHNCGFEGLNQKTVYHHYVPSEFIVEGNRSHKIYHLGDIELFTSDAPIREHPRGKFVSTGKEDLDKRLKECIPIYVQYVKMTKSTEGVSQHEISYLLPTDPTEVASVSASVQQPDPQSQASLINIMNTKITVEEKQKKEQEELKAREDEDRRKEEELRRREEQLRTEEERTRSEQERLRVETMRVEEEKIEREREELDRLQKEEKETERRILQEKAEEQRRIEEEAIHEQRRLEFEARKEEERKAQEEYEKKKAEYQKRLEEYWHREEERQKEVARREEERRRLTEQKVREYKTQTHLLPEDSDAGGFDQSSELRIQAVATLDPCVVYYERQQKQALNYLDQRLQGQAFSDPCIKRH